MDRSISGATPRGRLAGAVLAWLAVVAVAAPARGQGPAVEGGWEYSRFGGAVTLVNTQPLGELDTGPGLGLGLAASWAVDPGRRLRVRGELRVAGYGLERQRACLGEPVGCRIEFDVNTVYSTLYAGAGPEVAVPLFGSVLVLDATVGYGMFSVDSSIEGVDDEESLLDTNNFRDGFLAWSAGGELRVPVSRQVALSLGAHYQRNGVASYLREGDLGRAADGSLLFDVQTSAANQAVLTLGVAFRPVVSRSRADHAGG